MVVAKTDKHAELLTKGNGQNCNYEQPLCLARSRQWREQQLKFNNAHPANALPSFILQKEVPLNCGEYLFQRWTFHQRLKKPTLMLSVCLLLRLILPLWNLGKIKKLQMTTTNFFFESFFKFHPAVTWTWSHSCGEGPSRWTNRSRAVWRLPPDKLIDCLHLNYNG